MKCLLDLDGVLVNFVGGAMRHHGKELPYESIRWNLEAQLGMTPADFWRPLGEDFWAGLERMPDAWSLLGILEGECGKEDIYLCSSPCLTAGCATGKVRWVEQHLAAYRRRLILSANKEVFAAPDRLLVDDSDANCEKWRKAGGMALLVPRPWNENRGENTLEYVRGWFDAGRNCP